MWHYRLYIVMLLGCQWAGSSLAQHPIDVQRALANGQYFQALVTYDRLPKRTDTSASMYAAARSAWALSLPTRASDEFDRALRDEQLTTSERARIFLSKGIIELQELRYQVAVLYAQRAVQLLGDEDSNLALRSKAYFLWAEALSKQRQFGEAEVKYVSALQGSAESDLPQFHFALGNCRMQLGKYSEAREEFERVPQEHELTSAAIRKLAVLAVEANNPSAAQFWLQRGLQSFADDFNLSINSFISGKYSFSVKSFKLKGTEVLLIS